MTEIVGIAYYKKEDWLFLLDLIDDRDSMHDTWKEWNKSYHETKSRLTSEGFIVEECIISLLELDAYCKLKRIKNDGKARSKFVSDKISQ